MERAKQLANKNQTCVEQAKNVCTLKLSVNEASKKFEELLNEATFGSAKYKILGHKIIFILKHRSPVPENDVKKIVALCISEKILSQEDHDIFFDLSNLFLSEQNQKIIEETSSEKFPFDLLFNNLLQILKRSLSLKEPLSLKESTSNIKKLVYFLLRVMDKGLYNPSPIVLLRYIRLHCPVEKLKTLNFWLKKNLSLNQPELCNIVDLIARSSYQKMQHFAREEKRILKRNILFLMEALKKQKSVSYSYAAIVLAEFLLRNFLFEKETAQIVRKILSELNENEDPDIFSRYNLCLGLEEEFIKKDWDKALECYKKAYSLPRQNFGRQEEIVLRFRKIEEDKNFDGNISDLDHKEISDKILAFFNMNNEPKNLALVHTIVSFMILAAYYKNSPAEVDELLQDFSKVKKTPVQKIRAIRALEKNMPELAVEALLPLVKEGDRTIAYFLFQFYLAKGELRKAHIFLNLSGKEESTIDFSPQDFLTRKLFSLVPEILMQPRIPLRIAKDKVFEQLSDLENLKSLSNSDAMEYISSFLLISEASSEDRLLTENYALALSALVDRITLDPTINLKNFLPVLSSLPLELSDQAKRNINIQISNPALVKDPDFLLNVLPELAKITNTTSWLKDLPEQLPSEISDEALARLYYTLGFFFSDTLEPKFLKIVGSVQEMIAERHKNFLIGQNDAFKQKRKKIIMQNQIACGQAIFRDKKTSNEKIEAVLKSFYELSEPISSKTQESLMPLLQKLYKDTNFEVVSEHPIPEAGVTVDFAIVKKGSPSSKKQIHFILEYNGPYHFAFKVQPNQQVSTVPTSKEEYRRKRLNKNKLLCVHLDFQTWAPIENSSEEEKLRYLKEIIEFETKKNLDGKNVTNSSTSAGKKK